MTLAWSALWPAPDTDVAASVNDVLSIPSTGEQDSQERFEVSATDSVRDPIFLVEPTRPSGAGRFEIKFQNASSASAPDGKVFYVSSRMTSASAQLATALPATPQDFAMLTAIGPAAESSLPAESMSTVSGGVSQGAGWEGDASAGASGGRSSASGSTLVGSSTVFTTPLDRREPGPREVIVKATSARPIRSILEDMAIVGEASDLLVVNAASLLNLQQLHPGSVAVVLLDRRQGNLRIASFSVVDGNGASSAIRLNAAGSEYEGAKDVEVAKRVVDYFAGSQDGGAGSRLRLMDGLYAAGIREGVPPTIMSETVMQMARGYDLGEFMQSDDRFTIIYADKPRDADRLSGHVLYAAITTRSSKLVCYVLKPGLDRDFTCMTEKDTITQQLGPKGFVTPVSGVLSSGFGPRVHPILNRVRVHQGVDWAAPSGTPIVSAFDGTIKFAGEKGGFGNFVQVEHPGGLATGYAHMSAFAKGLAAGQSVKAGELIGYVGTTGLSTGPHLHFELYMNGQPVDPFDSGNAPVANLSNEKEKLIGRIIHVESAGNPNAANPLSSAVGLGQFLAETWMRMIRAYRPDLARMSTNDILALRFDPTISREMLYHFASENEADLRRAGQQPTAGNLYLAHFLGSYGAITVLRAAPDEPIGNVVGYQVVSANPFLAGKDAQWVVNWAARKMSGPSTQLRAQLPPEVRVKNSRFASYSRAIDRLLKSIEQSRPG